MRKERKRERERGRERENVGEVGDVKEELARGYTEEGDDM